MTADFLAQIGRTLIIEFIPPTDSQVVGMLSRMPKAEAGYSIDLFERAYRERFRIHESESIPGSERRLYRMESTRSL